MHQDIERVLFSEAEIRGRVKNLAIQISDDYNHKEPILIVCILKSAFVFMADLMRNLSIPYKLDHVALSRYENRTTSANSIRLLLDLEFYVEDSHVLIVAGSMATGNTLNYIQQLLKNRHPASLRNCVLFDKPESHQVDLEIDYVGFNLPKHVWAVGYGHDYANKYRTLPYLGVLKPVIYKGSNTSI